MNNFDRRLHWLYLLVVIPFGLAFTVLVPPFRIPDEQRHYVASSAVVSGTLRCVNSRHKVDSRSLELISKMGLNKADNFPVQTFEKERLLNYTESKTYGYVSVYSLVCNSLLIGHAASSFGLLMGGILNQNFLVSFYMARFFNFVFGVLLVFWAIRISTQLKRAIFCVGILPTCVLHFSTITYDSLVVGGLLLLFSAVSSPNILKRKFLVVLTVTIPGLAASLLKPFYLPIVAAFFLIFLFKRQHFIKFMISIFITFMIALFASFVGVRIGVGDLQITSINDYSYFHETNVHLKERAPSIYFDQRYQLSRFVVEPFKVLIAYFFTLILSLPSLINEIFGYVGLDYRIYLNYLHLSVVVTVLMVLYCLPSLSPSSLSKHQKFLMLCSIFCCLVLLLSFLFVTITPVNYPLVNGFQIKYLIPLFVPISLLVSFKKTPYLNKTAWIVLLTLGVVITYFVSIESLVNWYNL